MLNSKEGIIIQKGYRIGSREMMIKHLPKDERPREKMMLHGKESLSNAELLAILLRTGTREKSVMELAQDVLALDESGIVFLQECTPEELAEIKGMGQAKSCQLLAAVELGRRIATVPRKKKEQIATPDDIAGLLMEKMRYYKNEHFMVLMINTKGQVIETYEASAGDLCSTVVHPREVFHRAIRRSAAAVVFAHNHPSGDPSPSNEDIETTGRLIEAAEILGIRVLDHIIIGDGTYISLKSKELM